MGDVQPVSVILLLDSGEWDEASRKCYYMYLSSAMHSVDNRPPTVVLKYWACIPLAWVDSYLCIHWFVISFSNLLIHAGMPSPLSAISWYLLLSGFFLKSLTMQQMLQSSPPVTKWFSGYVACRNSVWITSKTFAWCMLLATSEMPSITTLMGSWGGGSLLRRHKRKCGRLSENPGYPAFWFSGV